MTRLLKKNWPWLAAAFVLLSGIGLLFRYTLAGNDGHFVYALDDPYIHLAMARNFAEHGVWGVTRREFTASSSSPLWTLLNTAVFLLLGERLVAPFALALAFSLLALAVAAHILKSFAVPNTEVFPVLMALALMAPLPALVFGGMEHPLQIVLALALTFVAARILAGEESRNSVRFLLVMAPLLVATRYEGMFLLLVIAALALLRRRVKLGLTLPAAGALPVIIYGVISLRHGWSFLPAPILMKSGLVGATSLETFAGNLFARFRMNLVESPELVFLVAFLGTLELGRLRRENRERTPAQFMTLIFLATAVMHLVLARFGWLFRYEAYLIALGIVVAGCRIAAVKRIFLEDGSPTAKGGRSGRAALALFALATLSLLLFRGVSALAKVPRATRNIYEQHYQMARFVKTYYEGSAVALNDVGAVNFYSDIRCLDLWGLAHRDVAAHRMGGTYTREVIEGIAAREGARIAMVYDDWFAPEEVGLPTGWTLTGKWKVARNVVVGSDTVSIYAVDAAEVPRLIHALSEFSPTLPSSIEQTGLYIESRRAAETDNSSPERTEHAHRPGPRAREARAR